MSTANTRPTTTVSGRSLSAMAVGGGVVGGGVVGGGVVGGGVVGGGVVGGGVVGGGVVGGGVGDISIVTLPSVTTTATGSPFASPTITFDKSSGEVPGVVLAVKVIVANVLGDDTVLPAPKTIPATPVIVPATLSIVPGRKNVGSLF